MGLETMTPHRYVRIQQKLVHARIGVAIPLLATRTRRGLGRVPPSAAPSKFPNPECVLSDPT